MEIVGPQYQPVQKYIMNPKSLTIGELYGEVNLATLEWHDGILPLSLRTAVQVSVISQIVYVCVEGYWKICQRTTVFLNK